MLLIYKIYGTRYCKTLLTFQALLIGNYTAIEKHLSRWRQSQIRPNVKFDSVVHYVDIDSSYLYTVMTEM